MIIGAMFPGPLAESATAQDFRVHTWGDTIDAENYGTPTLQLTSFDTPADESPRPDIEAGDSIDGLYGVMTEWATECTFISHVLTLFGTPLASTSYEARYPQGVLNKARRQKLLEAY